MQVVEKNELEATALQEVGKLELVVAKVGQLAMENTKDFLLGLAI